MSIVENEDIKGFRIGEEIVCWNCLTDEETHNLSEDWAIKIDELDQIEKTFFCDRCKKRL